MHVYSHIICRLTKQAISKFKRVIIPIAHKTHSHTFNRES